MANKKIWAYALDETGQYVKGEKHPLKIFYIWESIKLRDNKIHEFNKLKFMSTQKDPAKRTEMSAVKNGFYRYKVGENNSNTIHDKDGSSLSHSIAIQVLAEMDEINFVFGEEEHKFEAKEIRSEYLKLQLTNRNRYEYYYPDLVCFFDTPKELSLKWESKVAIEVKHTHPCEDEKIQDFESHGIPIIEVNIKGISIEKKFNTKPPTPEQLENYYHYLKNTFRKKVYGKVLSNPVSNKYFNIKEHEHFKSLENQKANLDKATTTILILNAQIASNTKEIEGLKVAINSNKKNLAEKDKKILEIEDRGIGYFITKMLGFKR